jgi:hypothetical protein
MSQENVEIVRSFNAPHEGQNVVPVIREMVERLGPDPQPDAVLAEWGEDPGYQNLHPEFELDVSAAGAFGTVARGPREVMLSWAGWIEAWESYVYRTVEYRDIGDWVLQTVDVRARGRGDIPVEMRTFQVWQVRDGKVAVYRAFLSEQDALEAVGLSEQDARADS